MTSQWGQSTLNPKNHELWGECTRPHRMITLLASSPKFTRRLAVQLACALVRRTPRGDERTVWDLLADERSRNAIEVAEAWLRGEATDEQLRAAAYAAADATSEAAIKRAQRAEQDGITAYADALQRLAVQTEEDGIIVFDSVASHIASVDARYAAYCTINRRTVADDYAEWIADVVGCTEVSRLREVLLSLANVSDDDVSEYAQANIIREVVPNIQDI